MNKYSIEKLPIDILKEMAKRLKLLRKEKGLSQTALADRAGVSLGSLKRFESKGLVAFDSLLKLAHVLGHLSDFENVLKPEENNERLKKLFDS